MRGYRVGAATVVCGWIALLLLAAFWQWVVGALLVFVIGYLLKSWWADWRRYGTWGPPAEHREGVW